MIAVLKCLPNNSNIWIISLLASANCLFSSKLWLSWCLEWWIIFNCISYILVIMLLDSTCNLFLFWQEVTLFKSSAQVRWRWIFSFPLGPVTTLCPMIPTGTTSLLLGLKLSSLLGPTDSRGEIRVPYSSTSYFPFHLIASGWVWQFSSLLSSI